MDKSNANGWKSRKYKTSIIVGSEKKPTEFESGQVIINQKATEKNLDKLIKINKDGLEGKQKTEVTNDATDGGLLIGKPHYDKNGKPLGGIPGKVDGVKLIETETAEFVLNKEASEKHWKELSKINTSTGGVPINPPNKFDDDPEYDYKKGGNVIEFNPNHLPSKSIMNFANDVREKYPKVWDLGGNIFGNEAFKNLMTVRKRGYWLDSEEWMYIKWRAYVARHIHDFRIAGVIAMLKWGDKVEKGFPYMKELVEKEIEKRYKKELKESGGKLKLKYGGAITYKEKYNKAYGFEPKQSHSLEDISKTTGISLIGLQAIYNKGIGAYKTNPRSVRPSVKSKEQWAMARVYSAVMGGRAAKIDANELKLELGGSLDRRNLIYIGEQGSTNLSENEKINWGINEFDNKLRFEIDDSEFELVNFDVLYERANLNPNTEFKIKLSEVVVHPTLFKAYPELSNLELSYIYLSDTTQIASYNPKQNIIKYNFYGEDNQINSSDSISGLEEKAKRDKAIIRTNRLFQGRRDDLRKRVLLHELQHFAQYYDNLAEGSSIMREYRKLLQENEIDERRIGTAERDLLIQQAIINNQSNLGEMEAKDSEIRMKLSLDETKEIEPFTLLPYEVDKVIVTNTNIKSNNLKDKMADASSTENGAEKFIKWYISWFKDISDKMNIYFSLTNPITPFKEKNVVIMDLFEKIDQEIDAKQYLKEVINKADEYGVTIYLEPTPRHKYFLNDAEKRNKISKDYLISYYNNFSFELTPNKQFMKRLPKMKNGGLLPAQGTLTTADKKYKLDYQKVGSDYQFVVYEGEPKDFEGYTNVSFKKRDKNVVTMNYNQFIEYLYDKGYINDLVEYAEGGSTDEINQIKSEINKLYTKAFKMMPNSPRQKEVIKQIDELRIKLENMNGKFESGGSTDAKDTATIDIPLLIRLLELSREDIHSDAELHQVVERLLDLKNKPVLTMDDYAYIADIEHKHVNQMAVGGTLDSDPQKLISQAHYNITVKKGRKEYAPTAHEIQEEIDRMVMEGQFGSNNI